MKDSIVGDPSIIFNRYHVANETRIRNGDKLCKTIIGYDGGDWSMLKASWLTTSPETQLALSTLNGKDKMGSRTSPANTAFSAWLTT